MLTLLEWCFVFVCPF